MSGAGVSIEHQHSKPTIDKMCIARVGLPDPTSAWSNEQQAQGRTNRSQLIEEKERSFDKVCLDESGSTNARLTSLPGDFEVREAFRFETVYSNTSQRS